ncbi:hypothetical protein HMPREF1531_00812 [Propionibacterium sp. oral taxon 192 str. F0372]|nr:hypothetical protein HMPREF1531_00812 [Propionibacterium sp. oral taxon 192 str. F0372]
MTEIESVLADEAVFNLDPSNLLSDFLGRDVSAPSLGVKGIHHWATYIGEYRHDTELEEAVSAISEREGIGNVRWGPSHIAPHFYGVSGYWINLDNHGRQLEFFACRETSSWMARPQEERKRLMSHPGLEVDAPELVGPLLEFLAVLGHRTSSLHFEPMDQLGHTYGHLQRIDNGSVIELVHETQSGSLSVGW